jgi:hypothetical protein
MGFQISFLFLFQLVVSIAAKTLATISDLVNDFSLTYIEMKMISS